MWELYRDGTYGHTVDIVTLFKLSDKVMNINLKVVLAYVSNAV